MTIEQKLDWVLAKVKANQLTANKENAGIIFDNFIMKELYPDSDNNKENEQEWEQMKRVLLEEEKLIEKIDLDPIPEIKYGLTVKGKMFIGFEETKERATSNARFKKIIGRCAAIGTIGLLAIEFIKFILKLCGCIQFD